MACVEVVSPKPEIDKQVLLISHTVQWHFQHRLLLAAQKWQSNGIQNRREDVPVPSLLVLTNGTFFFLLKLDTYGIKSILDNILSTLTMSVSQSSAVKLYPTRYVRLQAFHLAKKNHILIPFINHNHEHVHPLFFRAFAEDCSLWSGWQTDVPLVDERTVISAHA